MSDTNEVIGPLATILRATWECVICGVSPPESEVFTLPSHGENIRDVTVTVQPMYISDCGILAGN